jgi:hypothetical protein
LLQDGTDDLGAQRPKRLEKAIGVHGLAACSWDAWTAASHTTPLRVMPYRRGDEMPVLQQGSCVRSFVRSFNEC